MYSPNPRIFEIPRLVRRKPKAPFQPRIRIETGLRTRFQQIREFDLEFQRFILKESDYVQIIEDAYSSNVHWSTKIEGNTLTEDEVKIITRESLSGSRSDKPNTQNQEIINHIGVLVFADKFALPWNEDIFKLVNFMLLQKTGTHVEAGKYRIHDGSIQEDGKDVFIPAPPDAILGQLSYLLEWVNDYSAAYEPVVTATVMFHEFESIHPFPDGNGRTGRTLFHLFLQLNGLQNSHLCKLDKQVLSNQSAYYQLLAYTDHSEEYSELIDYMSDAILKSYQDTHDELKSKDLLSSGMEESECRILIRAKQKGGWFRPMEAYGWVRGKSEQTIRNHLNQMCERGIFEKKGRTNSVMYRFKTPFDAWKNIFSDFSNLD